MVNNCPHCRSKYVALKDTEETFDKTIETYECQSCKKTFKHDIAREAPAGEWLMTLYGDEYRLIDKSYSYNTIVKVYKDGFNFGILQMSKGGTEVVRKRVKPKIYVHKVLDNYYLWMETFTHGGDPTGLTTSIRKIEMSPELLKEAKAEPAIRALYKKGECIVNTFREDTLLKDVKRWFDRVLCVPASNQKSGCYVATCVYGSYDCPQVWTLRRFRDDTLAQTGFGRAFIRVYYAVSPTLVKWFGETKWFKGMWRKVLDKMIGRLNADGVENTPYNDKKW